MGMKLFISGATGVLGKRVVNLLVGNNYNVVGLSRSKANTDWLTQKGVEARKGDLFNQEQMCELSSDCDGILHLATAIPTKSRTTSADWATNDRIRREGTQNLVEAACRNQAKLFVQQSVTFIYGDRHGEWVDEKVDISPKQSSILQSAVDMEKIIQTAAREKALPATILRFGMFYSFDAVHTRSMFELLQKRRFPVIGDGTNYWNMINVDDAARAIFMVVEDHDKAVSKTFNVCDDEPVVMRELLYYLAQKLNAKHPIALPKPLAKLLIGGDTVSYLTASVRCQNSLIKEELGWQPRYPNYRDGFRTELEKWLKI